MKINIVNSLDTLNNDDAEPVVLDKLESITDASCTYIKLNILDTLDNRNTVLQQAVQKLRYGGVLSIVGQDVTVLAHYIHLGHYDTQIINDLLYSNNKSISSMVDIASLLQKLGLKIILKRLDGTNYLIKAERPNPK